MSTGRKLVSDVRGMHKMLSTDGMITDRVILSEIRNNSLLLIKRETNLRKLWATDTLFTTIPCLEMTQVPVSECSGYVDPCNIARTKHPIPRIAEGHYQYLIQGVYSINIMSGKGKKLKEISINRYINLLRLPIIKKEEYYWISGDYLYVTNPDVQAVRISAMFEKDLPMHLFQSDCGCANPNLSVEEICKNPLDREFPLPGYLEKQALELTSQSLLYKYFQVKADTAQDGIEDQVLLNRSLYGYGHKNYKNNESSS